MTMQNFHPFVVPFCAGAIFLFAVLIYKFTKWIVHLNSQQRHAVKHNIFTVKTVKAIGEIIRESLIHNKIYRHNRLLGYMHCSLAFGWFLLIVVGKCEASAYSGTLLEEPWLGIFFKYFVRTEKGFAGAAIFSFTMDLLLAIILSGVCLAIFKRFKSRFLGMKKTTKHTPLDKMALSSLWLIFPLRLLAESITAGISGNGDFLTGTVGNLLTIMPLQALELPAWWAYSIALCVFFVALPYSRYMHIPAEVLLIFMRRWGATTDERRSGYTDMQLNACSRCGLCIDVCQLNTQAGINNVQAVYFVRDARYKALTDKVANNCLLCNRCVEACPVGIDLTKIRQQLRQKHEIAGKHYYDYAPIVATDKKPDVIYFAGCMTHLTPSIIIAMKKIFDAANINYWFMDEQKGLCCGRPLQQQGFTQQAADLKAKNTAMIEHSGAKVLVTSCPICYKSFNDEYDLKIKVMHHSEFINSLIQSGLIKLRRSDCSIVYHDPCELGRGSGIYEPPREILRQVGKLHKCSFEKRDALCCGGSLANTAVDTSIRMQIRDLTVQILTASHPDVLATTCPLCKKTFAQVYQLNVADIAELVAKNMMKTKNEKENFDMLNI